MAEQPRIVTRTAPAPRRIRRSTLAACSAAALTTTTACQGPEAFLDTAGPGADSIATLWWIMFSLGLAVYLGVLALVAVPVWRARRRHRDDAHDDAGRADPTLERTDDTSKVERRLLVAGGLVGTTTVLFGLYLASLPVLLAVAPAPSDDPDELVVEVVGHQFWWEVHYPDHDVVTANEITIPAGEPVRFRLHSADVIHSFWFPRLHGKVDMTPGHTTELVLEADEPGHYRGRCTEYCGLAHAQMILHLFAEEPDDFEAWLTAQSQPAEEPATGAEDRGQELFVTACAQCHTVEGVSPRTDIGPDLTHLASRETLAAGILPLTSEHLADWIADPQAMKPGAPMPATPLADDDMADLVAYLEALS